jgi:arylsulfatase A-like enzyme
VRILSAVTVAACLVLSVSCGQDSEHLNVMIIAVDTLRPDHLGCYGYPRHTSPCIDELADQGVLCENAMSHSPWTLPSFASVFTSLYPTQHGAVQLGNGLRSSFPTLAEILKAHGYTTGAVINAPTLKPANRVNRGFDFYDTVPRGTRVADGTTTDVLAWIDGAKDRPFFMFAHYFDPHLPYAPPAPYDRMFDCDYRGRIGNSFDAEGFAEEKSKRFSQMEVLTPEDWNHIRSLYDGEIVFTDTEIARLLRGLEERGLRQNTLIVFLSDHGEEFYDHGGFGHGHSLYSELITVPLIFSLPGRFAAGVRLTRQVRLVDVAPTILDVLEVGPTPGFEGVSLKPLLEGKGAVEASTTRLLPPDAALAEATTLGPEKKSITSYPWKLIYNMGTQERTLFNLEEDPEERHDLGPEGLPRQRELEQMLFTALFRMSETWYVELSGGSEGHTFDLRITAERGPSIGRIHPFKVLDGGGDIIDVGDAFAQMASESVLRAGDLTVKGTLTLAFQVEPATWPVRFDIAIDGRSALKQTYLGEDMGNPEEIPFTVRRRRGTVKSGGRPDGERETPCAVVWLSASPYGDLVTVKHDDETKEEFRALGYIQ